jgi:two-component system sensor histidine kinase KdpD
MSADTDIRPSPEALLSQASREGRGRLKVFLGAAPGVGKTWAMLDEAHRKQAEGVDVVAALIETHGRAETQAKLAGVTQLPRKPVLYQGRALTEMDLDALLARKPRLALIDELAHTNAEGSRHEKRWQDVEEVLAAGIDVYATLNIQHIETLNETVARITGVRVRETVPDGALEMADEIELIDLPPDELVERLKQGKIYPADQASRALGSFFVKGNLTALRELAMRTAADRVDAQLREHMAANAIAGPWPTQERVLVCLNESPAAREAIRVAKRSADRARADWIALNVVQARAETLPEADKDRLAGSLRLAERLGAELATLESEHDVAKAILDYAKSRNVRRIVIGRPRPRPFWLRLAGEDVASDLLRRSGPFEVTLASGPEDRPTAPKPRMPFLQSDTVCRRPRLGLFLRRGPAVSHRQPQRHLHDGSGLRGQPPWPRPRTRHSGRWLHGLQLSLHRAALHFPGLAAGRTSDLGPLPCRLVDHRQPGRPAACPDRGAVGHLGSDQQALRLQPPCRIGGDGR